MRNLFPLLLAWIPLCAAPPEEGDDASELARLLNTPITVASKTASTVRETPGVVSVITRDEIQAGGARGFTDILRMVPGFDFGADVQGATGPSIRGLWGYEGKILLLWDGVEMNETLFGCVRIDEHFPVDQIKRVEIIRGPGSSVYGGFAELAVIQVTTLGPEDLAGAGGAGYTYGRGREAAYHDTFQAILGHGGPVAFTLGAYGGRTIRSDGVYTDPGGTAFNVKDNGLARPLLVNLGVEAGDLRFRAIVDGYQATQRDNFAGALPAAETVRESSVNLDLRYTWKPRAGLAVTPFLLWRDQKPFWADSASEGFATFQVNRRRAGVGLDWALDPDVSLALGVEGQEDRAETAGATASPFPGGAAAISYTSKAAYGQVEYRGPVNLTLGARWENHSQVGSAFVPRLGLTKIIGRFHVKLLFADSFRTPSIMNISQVLDPTRATQAEKTRTVELEGGAQLGPGILTLNLFDTRIKQPIVYSSGATGVGYVNQPTNGSRGVELEWKLRQAWGHLNVSFSHYEAADPASIWVVPGHAQQFLGAAPNKVAAAAGIRMGSRWTLGPGLLWLDRRWQYVWSPRAGALALDTRSADLVANLNLTYSRDAFTASVGVFDLGDRRIPFIQPYYGHGPLPGPGRELAAKVRYGF